MEVLNKLRNTVSNTLSNTVTSTAHGLSQLSSVLPGNPVTREFEVSTFICSAGPGLLWKVYTGYKKSTKQNAAIFVFEKRLLDQWPEKLVRENIVETLKKGVIQLTKLRHPHILTVQHPLEESRDSLAFATEPVLASLANILGSVDNVPHSSQIILKDYKIFDLEMKFGLFQLGESLTFLHNDVKMLHRNICPESIIINDHGDWKIFGFDFCAVNQTSDEKPSWSYLDYNSIPTNVRTSIHYQAPECIMTKTTAISSSSDMFSFGVLICFLHTFHNPFWNYRKDISNYKNYLEELKNIISLAKSFNLSNSLKETVKLMLHNDSQLRPDAYEFVKIEYFNDLEVKTLIYLDKLFQWDNLHKSQFYKELPQILKQFPRRVIFQKILPALQKEFVNAPMIPFLLPSILQVMEDCTTEEFEKCILPMLKQILVIEEPPQISLLLLQKIELSLKWCSQDVVKNFILPMMIRALDSKLEQLQEHCLIALPTIIKIVDSSCIKNFILPRIKKICLVGPSGNYSLGVRINCLLCLSKILDNLHPWVVKEEILPFLQEVPCAGEPAILMAIIGIFKLILTNSKLGISKENLATKILPFLLPLCIEQSFSPKQYESLVLLVNDMINQVTKEHREALHQLQKTRQFHKNISGTSKISTYMNNFEDTVISSTSSLGLFESNSFVVPIQNKLQSCQSRALSLDEKHRLARQEEINKKMNDQKPLIPNIISPITIKNEPKNLTNTLTNNLNELNWSSTKTNFSEIVPNYVNVITNDFSINSIPQALTNQMPKNQELSRTLNWDQTVTKNLNANINEILLNGSKIDWTSPIFNSSLQTQSIQKLSSEEIMDFLK